MKSKKVIALMVLASTTFMNLNSIDTVALVKEVSVNLTNSSDFKYEKFNSGIKITGYNGSLNIFEIPDSIDNKPVISIGNMKSSNIRNITIPSTVTSIDKGAFEGCENLEKVVFKSNTNLEILPSCTFKKCDKLSYVDLSKCSKINKIDIGAFSQCKNLKECFVPENLTIIESEAFDTCNNLKILSSIESYEHAKEEKKVDELNSWYDFNNILDIGSRTFEGCGIEELHLNYKTKLRFNSFAKCKELKKITIDNSIPQIVGGVYTEYEGMDELPEGVFSNCSNLTEVNLPKTLKTIGKWAFDSCTSLSEITIPAKVTSIDQMAFYNCTNLNKIIFDEYKDLNSEKMIGAENVSCSSFMNCTNIKEVTLPSTISKLTMDDSKDVIFTISNLNNNIIKQISRNNATIVIKEGITKIDSESFQGVTGFKRVILPGSIKTIDNNAFKKCEDLESVSIANEGKSNIESIGDNAFEGCKLLKNVPITQNTKIGKDAFKSTNMEGKYYGSLEYKVSEDRSYVTITNIHGIFNDNEIVTIPDVIPVLNANTGKYDNIKVKNISDDALSANYKKIRIASDKIEYNINKISQDKEVILDGFICSVNENGLVINGVEDEIIKDGTLNIPNEIYGQTVIKIGNASFMDNKNINKVVINAKNITIGEEAFRGCTELASIEITGKVNAIGDRAFYSCNNIGDTIKLSRSSIDGNISLKSFNNSSITKIQIGDDYVYSFASEGIIKLVSYIGGESTPTIPETMNQNKLTTIGAGAFKDNAKITKVSLSNNIENIEDNAFFNCTSLKGIIAPQVKYVGFNILGQTTCETSLDVNSGLKYINIGNSAIVTGFIDGNDKRTKLEIPSKLGEAKVISINYRAFTGNTNLKELVIPSSMVSISDEAFDGCINLDEGEISKVVRVGKNAFTKNLERRTSGDYSYCVIGNEVKIVGYQGNDKEVKEITIPEEIDGIKVTSIGSQAFLGYTKLETVTNFNKGVKTNITDVENDAFLGTALINKIYNNYIYNPKTKTIRGYIGTNSEIIIPSEINGSKICAIEESAFKDNINLKKVTISDGITTIENKAFSGCTSLETIVKPKTITKIAEDAFTNTKIKTDTNTEEENKKNNTTKDDNSKTEDTSDNAKVPIATALIALLMTLRLKKKND